MRHPLALLLIVCGLCAGITSAQAVDCTCAAAIETNGWCEAHQLGYVGSIEITSSKLYDALDAHGHVLDPQAMECAACRAAFATGGFCEEHRIGFVNRLGYFSRLTYHLAKGEKRSLSDVTCPVCRENAVTYGWCEACEVGMVGNVAIKGRSDWAHVAKALGMLEAAIAASSRCETCATAIALDGYCPFCQIYYKDGKPVPPPSAEAPAPPDP